MAMAPAPVTPAPDMAAPPAAPQTVTVMVGPGGGMSFVPAQVTVHAGDTVQFTVFNDTLVCRVYGVIAVSFTDSGSPFGPQTLGGMWFNQVSSPTIPRFDDFSVTQATSA